jgi:hypothetical protein
MPAALADEMPFLGTELGGHPSDLIVRDPQEPLVLIHLTFCSRGIGKCLPRMRWVPGPNGWALLGKGKF